LAKYYYKSTAGYSWSIPSAVYHSYVFFSGWYCPPQHGYIFPSTLEGYILPAVSFVKDVTVKLPAKYGLDVHAYGSGVQLWWKNASYYVGKSSTSSSSKSAHI